MLVSGKPCAAGHVELAGPVRVEQSLSGAGTARIGGLPDGRYSATAHCSNAIERTLDLVIAGKSVEHSWNLQSLPESPIAEEDAQIPQLGGTIRVSVQPEARRFDELYVFAEYGGVILRPSRKSAHEFAFDGVPLGDYKIHVEDDVERARVVKLTHPGELVELRLDAGERVRLSGTVIDADGSPVRDAWVTHFRSDLETARLMSRQPRLTDGEGRFAFLGSPDALYTISVESPMGNAELKRVRGGDPLVIRVAAQGFVSGRVQTTEQRPVAEFIVTYEREGDSEYGELRGFNSEFVLPSLPPGTYTFGVRSDVGVASRTALIRPGDDVTLTFTLAR